MASKGLLLRNATVVDGTGVPAQQLDVVVHDRIIAAVEPVGRLSGMGHRSLDMAGAVLTPGFIDVHSHADNAPFLRAADVSKISQCVTTEVVGNCGFSLAPCTPATSGTLQSYTSRLFPPIDFRWNGFAELLTATDAKGYVTNYVPLVGHHAVRIAAMGMSDAAPDERQQRLMHDLVSEASEAGAFGLSTGLIYPPGMFATSEEISDLVGGLPESGIYTTHLRNEGSQLMASLEEAIQVGERTGRRVQVSHLKAIGQPNWGMVATAIERLDRARRAGVDIRHDVYPYTAASTVLSATLPPRFQEGGESAVLARLQEPNELARLRREIERHDGSWESIVRGAGWNGVTIATSASHRFEGLSVTEIGHRLGTDPFDALVHILVTERLKVTMNVFCLHEDDILSALASPWTMIGSDGLPPGMEGRPHPRMYGTFPRILARYRRQSGVLSLEESIRRMTSLPADTFNIADRGIIAPGKAADLVAFDANLVEDRADYDHPTRLPSGIEWVMVNGEVVVRLGEYLHKKAGKRLVPGVH